MARQKASVLNLRVWRRNRTHRRDNRRFRGARTKGENGPVAGIVLHNNGLTLLSAFDVALKGMGFQPSQIVITKTVSLSENSSLMFAATIDAESSGPIKCLGLKLSRAGYGTNEEIFGKWNFGASLASPIVRAIRSCPHSTLSRIIRLADGSRVSGA